MEFLPVWFREPEILISSPLMLIFAVFHLWMLIDAGRRQEWLWFAFMLIFPGISTLFYFFLVYRGADSLTRGFELPGAHSRRRIKELQAQIHHLDKAHHRLQLGDIYFQQGKLDLAEKEYRAAMERDSTDRDIRAHLGQCLLRQKKPAEARPLLESVVSEDSKHDYGYTMMALAECYAAEGQNDAAVAVWQKLLEHYSYARARVQLAELYRARGNARGARAQLQEVVESDVHAPAFDRRRNRVWIRRARRMLKQLPA